MPNFCENIVIISGGENDLKTIVDAKFSFEKLHPCPLALIANDNEATRRVLDWRIMNWGTKWDVVDDDEGFVYYRLLSASKECIKAKLLTAWSPPMRLFEYLTSQMEGLRVTIHCWEPGCNIVCSLHIANGCSECCEPADEVEFIREWFDPEYEPYVSDDE